MTIHLPGVCCESPLPTVSQPGDASGHGPTLYESQGIPGQRAENNSELEKVLQGYGGDGWELVRITGPLSGVGGSKALFKKPSTN